jgi:hypothetical protein
VEKHISDYFYGRIKPDVLYRTVFWESGTVKEY